MIKKRLRKNQEGNEVPVWGILLIILGVLAAGLVVLYFVGRRMQKKQDAQKEQIEAMKQTVSMLVFDKKRLRLKDSGLPQIAIDQTPKLARIQKVPIVKARPNIPGAKAMSFIADEKIYDLIPTKKEIKADISGIYIIGVRGIRGPLEAPKKKKGFSERVRSSLTKAQDKASEISKEEEKNKKKKKK